MNPQVVIVLQGRQAGKKAVVIKQLDDGTKERPYPHALIAGVERYPKKVTKRMGSKKLAKRNKVKPFIKVRFPRLSLDCLSTLTYRCYYEQAVNYSHLFPTRYAFELESLKGSVTADTFREPSQREDSKKQIKKLLEERYISGKNKWFFTPLRVSSFRIECERVLIDVL
jgi:large subunit ribosomal protein L27e